ncbi:cell division protein FtsQ/DivIB [Dendrosporobacter sp. 1207_IL3150]|uniref:cell division protein FtsQ/DivIB n=1 Tax=Dendrosporobacter sp. 1207_IL3150 TaxID=3084054 RepID=UPI002FD88173
MDRLEYKPPDKQKDLKKVFPSLILILIILIAGFLFMNSSSFNMKSVIVQGNKYMSEEEVIRIAGLPDNINILRLNTSEIKTRLSHDLRIAEAEVSRQFPGTVVLKIAERKPIAYVASSYGFMEIDKQGIILAVYKNLKKVSVPMITGVRLESGYVGDQVQNQAIQYILNYLSNLDEQTINNLSEINFSSSGSMFAYTNNSVQIRIGTNENLADKANLTKDILKEITEKKLIVDYIDLSYSSPFIKFKN